MPSEDWRDSWIIGTHHERQPSRAAADWEELWPALAGAFAAAFIGHQFHVRTQPMSDPFRTLGLSYPCNEEAVRRRVRELARTHHPDLNNGQGHARMAEINAAADVAIRIIRGG